MKRLNYWIGFKKRFQGIGFIFQFNDPYGKDNYYAFEFTFLWFDAWVTYELKKRNTN